MCSSADQLPFAPGSWLVLEGKVKGRSNSSVAAAFEGPLSPYRLKSF